jgi:hypothetical protein
LSASRSLLRAGLAAVAVAALTAGLAPAASAGEPPSTFCQLHWRWVALGDGVAYPEPYMVC